MCSFIFTFILMITYILWCFAWSCWPGFTFLYAISNWLASKLLHQNYVINSSPMLVKLFFLKETLKHENANKKYQMHSVLQFHWKTLWNKFIEYFMCFLTVRGFSCILRDKKTHFLKISHLMYSWFMYSVTVCLDSYW